MQWNEIPAAPQPLEDFQVHAQVLVTPWVVITISLALPIVSTRNFETVPTGGPNFIARFRFS